MNSNDIKRAIAKISKPAYRLYVQYKTRLYSKRDPREIADELYLKNFGRHINWEHPTEFNEKLRWMQFNTDTSIWSLLADKYMVRNFVENKGYKDILIPLLGVWEDAKDIDFDLLPNSFVLKTNHGCGDVFVVSSKEKINLEKIRSELNYFLKNPYGYKTAEPHYLSIKPLIIAEKMLINDKTWSSSLVDYKFYCFNGKPFCCGVFFDRDISRHTKVAEMYDMDWVRHDEWVKDNCRPQKPIDVPRPKCLNLMRKACEDLAGEFPFVRMDFYEVNDDFWFGEFTFTPSYCGGGSLSDALNQEMGTMIEIAAH